MQIVLRTIAVHRHALSPVGKRIDICDYIEGADCLGDFAIHEHLTAWVDPHGPLWTVSHIPTGWACLHTRTKRAALAARRAFVGSGIRWDFAEPGAMTVEQREMGRTIKREWEGR